MSAFHRIDDVRTMPALRFINFALRLVAYKGIVRALVEQAEHEKASVDQTPPASRGGSTSRDRAVESSPANLRHDPALAGLIEVR
jgi:hypothetical protein